jgi:predicted metalloendopeptidase
MTDMAKKKTGKTKSKTKPQQAKSKAKLEKSNSNSKMKQKSVKKVPAKPISGYLENLDAVADEKGISDHLKHLYAVANDLGIGCEIHHDKDSGGYVVSLDEASEDRSFLTAAEAEEFLHEQEQE